MTSIQIVDNHSDGGPRRAPVRIGAMAPNFRARSTLGYVDSKTYRGRWLIFFSHPADFTPVCTSEFVALARSAGAFEHRDCALLGLSVDSLYSHLAWITAIREIFEVEIPFPIVEDPSMTVATAYGMLDEAAQDSSTVRAVYFIDPTGIVRATMSYPLSVGRSVDEMLRLLDALQRTDADDVLVPEGWRPGSPVLLSPLQHAELIPQAEKGEPWFYRQREDEK